MTSIFSKFMEAAKTHSDLPALIFDNTVVTYGSLLKRVEGLAENIQAWFLEYQHRPVSHSDRIGVSLEKGIDLYTSIFSIMSLDASYIPLDPNANIKSNEYIVSKCSCLLIINERWLADHSAQQGRPAQSSHELISNDKKGIATDLVYTIFTSGSSGLPKGVDVSNANLLNLVDWAIDKFKFGPKVRTLQYSTINFDASILDIFPTLLSGATLCIPSRSQRMSEVELAKLCKDQNITHAFLPPALLNTFSSESFTTLKIIMTGGELSQPQSVCNWSNGRMLYNLYGPTECTVLVSCKLMSSETDPRNIGTAISNTRLHILDDRLQPTNLGELFISGLAVAVGYHNDQKETESKFINLPTIDSSRLYKTGDLVEKNQDGTLNFLGRVDRQVKIRGFRVELQEIEIALNKIGFKEAAAQIDQDGSLVAFIVSTDLSLINSARSILRETLPDHKIPKHFVRLEKMPYKDSGKIDLSELRRLRNEANPVSSSTSTIEAEAKANKDLIEIWSSELTIPPETIGQNSNFRDLGGSSINIMRLLARVNEKYGIMINFIDFLENPTISFLAEEINLRGAKC